MTDNRNLKNLTVTGFASDNKKLLAKKEKASKKLKNKMNKVGEVRNDFADAFGNSNPNFENESDEKIIDIQIEINDLLTKIKKISTVLSTLYQDQIDELENAKRTLIRKLDDFKGLSEDKRDSFKQQLETIWKSFNLNK